MFQPCLQITCHCYNFLISQSNYKLDQCRNMHSFSNKTEVFFFSFLSYLHSCTAQWTLEENGNSSTNMSRRTDSTGESSFFTSPLFLFYSAPVLFSKLLFTQECRNCCLCSARLSKWYWWLRTRCVTDWWCCWNSAHSLPLDTIRQRLISSFRTHFAFSIQGHVAFHFNSHTCPAHIRYIAPK